MAEAAEKDLRTAEKALQHVVHQARLALHAMKAIEMALVSNEQDDLAAAVRDALDTIERDAIEAAYQINLSIDGDSNG